ncbi:MAG: hypothetical protein AABZ23_01710, partial [Deltaproteobacteria bacterium]
MFYDRAISLRTARFVLIFSLPLFFLFPAVPSAETFRFSAVAMGTDIELIASVENEAVARDSFDAAVSEFK